MWDLRKSILGSSATANIQDRGGSVRIRQAFAKHILFPIAYVRTDIGTHLKELERSQWFSLQQIQETQWAKLLRLVSHAYSNVPYYRDLFDGHGIKPSNINSFDDLWKIPLLSKKAIRENFDRMVADTFDRKSLIRSTTSGSTGEPVTILRDRHAQGIASASGLRFRKWAGHDVGEKSARIWGRVIELDETATKKDESPAFSLGGMKMGIKQKLGNAIDPTVTLSAYDTMSQEVMEEFFVRIKRIKVTVLVGYVSAVYFFAEFVNENHQGEITLKAVRTVSEVLYEHQKKAMEKAFQCPVFNVYGAREFVLMASECSFHRGLHMNAENLYVEVLNSVGRPVPNGESGEIAITDLNNYAMPLIRYLIGDQGTLSGGVCPCGRGLPMIKEITGRVVDMISVSDGNFLHGTIFVGYMHNFAAEVERFRVVQRKQGEADLYLKLYSPLTAERFGVLKRSLQEIMHNQLSITIHVVEELPIDISGKYRYVISDVHKEAGRRIVQ